MYTTTPCTILRFASLPINYFLGSSGDSKVPACSILAVVETTPLLHALKPLWEATCAVVYFYVFNLSKICPSRKFRCTIETGNLLHVDGGHH